MVVTIEQQRNKDDDDKVEKEKTGESTFNPYKRRKKTGKSVKVIAEEKRELLKAEREGLREKGTRLRKLEIERTST